MITIKDHEVKNTVEELTVKEFEDITEINSSELDYVEKQIKIFSYLGVPEEIWDDMSIPEFKEYIHAFNNVPIKSYPFVESLEIEGYTYIAFEDEFQLSVRDLKHIEKKVKSGDNYIAYILAVLFKREDLTKKEHYDKAHLKLKEKLFYKLPAAVCVPYVTAIGKELNNALENKIEQEENEDTEGVE